MFILLKWWVFVKILTYVNHIQGLAALCWFVNRRGESAIGFARQTLDSFLIQDKASMEIE